VLLALGLGDYGDGDVGVRALNTAVMFSKATDEWSTPQDFFDALDSEFRFGLDAAASEDNAKCAAFFSREDDALTRSWYPGQGFSVWLNPPYSRCRDFIAKAYRESRKPDGEACTVVCLVPARTDTRWFHSYVWDGLCVHGPIPGVEVRFVRGRLKFGGSKNSAPFPSVVVIFRPPAGVSLMSPKPWATREVSR
jgi:phage N-6-adenine-methyltransferase